MTFRIPESFRAGSATRNFRFAKRARTWARRSSVAYTYTGYRRRRTFSPAAGPDRTHYRFRRRGEQVLAAGRPCTAWFCRRPRVYATRTSAKVFARGGRQAIRAPNVFVSESIGRDVANETHETTRRRVYRTATAATYKRNTRAAAAAAAAPFTRCIITRPVRRADRYKSLSAGVKQCAY